MKLASMSSRELAALEVRVAAIKKAKRSEAREQVKTRIEAVARDHGFKLSDLGLGPRMGRPPKR